MPLNLSPAPPFPLRRVPVCLYFARQATEAYDLRGCSFRGADLHQKALAGAFVVDTDMSGANMREAVLTKVHGDLEKRQRQHKMI